MIKILQKFLEALKNIIGSDFNHLVIGKHSIPKEKLEY